MDTLLAKPHIRRHASGHHSYIDIDGVSEKVYTVDEVFSRLEKNLNDYYGTNYKLD